MLMTANTETVRQQNRALILAALRQCGALAHTDIGGWTGLSSASVSAITADLLAENIIVKSEAPSTSGRGRPKVLFKQNPQAAHVIAIRITYDQIECSLADYTGTLKDRFYEKRPVEEVEPEAFIARFRSCLEKILARTNLTRQQVKTISITSKGLVADGRAVLLWSPVFGGKPVNFDEAIGKDWDARIMLTHETRFAAEAVAREMGDHLSENVNYTSATLSLGHSIGFGIATNKPGQRIKSSAPAFGHMTHIPDGPLCRCGAKGCIEAFAGFYAILRAAFEVPYDTIPANFVPMAEIDRLADNARRGDRMAEFAFRRAGEALGIGLARVMALYGPMPLTLTGPGMKYLDLMQIELEEPIRNNLEVRYTKMPEIKFHSDQAALVYDGNIKSCLSSLDTNVLAVGKR